MAFEELPAEYKSFFDTGELPPSMADEHAASLEAARVAQEAQEAAEVAARKAAEVVVPPVVETPPVVIEPAPVATPNNQYLDRLLAEQDARSKVLEQQLDEMKKQIAKANEPLPPDPQTDPLGYLAHKIEATQKEIAALAESQKAAVAETAQQNQVNAFLTNVSNQVKAFTDVHPDYNDAYKHLATMRMQDFKDVGMTDDQAKQAFGQEELGITQRALVLGKNPAEIAYGMAKRYGYKAVAVAQPTKTPTEADNKLDVIKKGLEASKTSERAIPPADVDVDNLRNMSNKDLQHMVENDWDKLFGKSKGIFS